MTQEEALAQAIDALAPVCLSDLQIDIFRRAWNKQSYHKISGELNHEYSYIKDVGAELWKLLSEAFGIKITKLNLREALSSTQSLGLHRSSVSSQRVDWGEAVDVSQFSGRQAELAMLEQWVMQEDCRFVALVGVGGIGKTMLVTQLAQQLTERDEFEIVVWRSLRQAPPLIDLLAELIYTLVPDQLFPIRLDAMLRHLLVQLRQYRCLLVLDNAEALLLSGELVGTYRPGYEDYGLLFQQLGSPHQSIILLTSREIPAEVAIQAAPTAAVRFLRLEPLSIEDSKTILSAKGLSLQAQQAQVRELIERYQGNPLALEIVATPLQDLFDSNIAAFLAEETLLFKDIRGLLTQQFDRLSSLEQQVMYWLAINREAVSSTQLQSDLLPSVSQAELRDALVSLDRRSLVERVKPISILRTAITTIEGIRYTQQPVVMEYVIERLIEQVCREITQTEIECFRNHALLKAQAKDYVSEVQLRLIVQPILARLVEVQGGRENLRHLLLQLLRMQQRQARFQPGYFAGNVIHLLRQLGVDLSHLNFSNLAIWQADLRMLNLHGTNFSQADLSNSSFTQSMSDILCVAFSPNAQLIATSHDNGEVCVWRVADGQQMIAFRGIASWINSLVFSVDSETLLVSSADSVVKRLHLASGNVRGELHGHQGVVLNIALSADGCLLASGGEDGVIKIWDMQTDLCVMTLEGHQGWIGALAFDPASNQNYRVASGSSDHTIRIWDVQSGHTMQTLEGHTNGLLALVFSPDGQTLASSSLDQTIRLWDAQTEEALAVWRHTAATWTLAFSPDGQTLASGSEDQMIKLWDVATQQCQRTLQGHTGVVQSISYSTDGLMLVSAALNQSVRLWNAQTGQCLKTWQGHSKLVSSAIFHPDGQRVASAHGDKALRLWNVQTGDCLSCLQGHRDRISSVMFSPDGRLLASGSFDQTVRLWDVETGNFLRSMRTQSWVAALTFSVDGSLLASSGVDRVVRVWEVATGQCLRAIEAGGSWIPAIAFSPQGRRLASCNEDGSVKLWNADTSECLLTLKGHTRQTQAVAFDPSDQRLASGSDDHTVKLWDLKTGQCIQTLQGHTHPVVSVDFHPTRNLLASGSFDHTLKLWDLQQGALIATLQGHTSPLRSVAFDLEGRWIVSSGDDGTIRLWDSTTGDCVRVLTVERPYEGMNISGVTGLTDCQKETLRVLGAIP
jgi:WD40 repeat protein